MDVTQGADGKYYLYDSKRKICTLIGASLPSLDDLAANGTLRDCIRTEEDAPADDEEYIKEVIDANMTFDATGYLKTGEVANSTSEFYAYQLKGITIEQLTKDGQDCIPTAESSSAMRVALYYRQSKWTPFFEQLLPDAEGAPVVLDEDEVSEIRAAIPVEGATLEINIIDEEGENPPLLFKAFFVPDASGVTHIDADGIKATITYEKGGSPLVDAHWGMMRVYDFYKNVFGRDKGMRIAYLTLTKYCSSETDFSTICKCWQQAFEELYGKDSAETQAVIRAWAAVGIDNAVVTGIEGINGLPTATELYYDLQGRVLQTPPSKGVYIIKSAKERSRIKKVIMR